MFRRKRISILGLISLAVGLLGVTPKALGIPLPKEMILYDPNDPVRYQSMLGADKTEWYREQWRKFLETPIRDLPRNKNTINFVASEDLKQKLGYDPSFSAPENSIFEFPLGVLAATSKIHQWSLGSFAEILPVNPQNPNENVGHAVFIPSIFDELTFDQIVKLTDGYNKPVSLYPMFMDIIFNEITPPSEAISKIATWKVHEFLDKMNIGGRKIKNLRLIDVIPLERLRKYTVSSINDLYKVNFNRIPNWQSYSISIEELGEVVLSYFKVKHLVNLNPDNLRPMFVQLDVHSSKGPTAGHTLPLPKVHNQSTQNLSTQEEICLDSCDNSELASSPFKNKTPLEGVGVVDQKTKVLGGTTGLNISDLQGVEPSGFKIFNPLNSFLSLKFTLNSKQHVVDLDWFLQLLFLGKDNEIVSTPHRYYYNTILGNAPEKTLLILPTSDGSPLGLNSSPVPNSKNVNLEKTPFCDTSLKQLLETVKQQSKISGGLDDIYNYLLVVYNISKQLNQINNEAVDNPDLVDYCSLIAKLDSRLSLLVPPSLDGVYIIESAGYGVGIRYLLGLNRYLRLFMIGGRLVGELTYWFGNYILAYPEMYTIYLAVHNGSVISTWGYYNYNSEMCNNYRTLNSGFIYDDLAYYYRRNGFRPYYNYANICSAWIFDAFNDHNFDPLIRFRMNNTIMSKFYNNFINTQILPNVSNNWWNNNPYNYAYSIMPEFNLFRFMSEYNFFSSLGYPSYPMTPQQISQLQSQTFSSLVNYYVSRINDLGNQIRNNSTVNPQCVYFNNYLEKFHKNNFKKTSPLAPLPPDAPISADIVSETTSLGITYWYYTNIRPKPQYQTCIQQMASPSNLLGFNYNFNPSIYSLSMTNFQVDRYIRPLSVVLPRRKLIDYFLYDIVLQRNFACYSHFYKYGPNYFGPFSYLYRVNLDDDWESNTTSKNLQLFNQFIQRESQNPISYTLLDYMRLGDNYLSQLDRDDWPYRIHRYIYLGPPFHGTAYGHPYYYGPSFNVELYAQPAIIRQYAPSYFYDHVYRYYPLLYNLKLYPGLNSDSVKDFHLYNYKRLRNRYNIGDRYGNLLVTYMGNGRFVPHISGFAGNGQMYFPIVINSDNAVNLPVLSSIVIDDESFGESIAYEVSTHTFNRNYCSNDSVNPLLVSIFDNYQEFGVPPAP